MTCNLDSLKYLWTSSKPIVQADVIEQITRTAFMVTAGPTHNILSNCFPFIDNFSLNYFQLSKDNVAQQSLLPNQITSSLFEEIQELKQLAGVSKSINVYTGAIYSMYSSGGKLSFTSPILCIPFFYIIRPNGSYFKDPSSKEMGMSNIWSFSDDEVRFFIARELAVIGNNHNFLHMLFKIVFFATQALLFLGSFWMMPPLLGVATLVFGAQLWQERSFQSKMDLVATRILEKKYGKEKAASIAIQTLEKLRQQNIEKRTDNRKMRWYISEKGNNFLDITTPLLTTRIDRIRSFLQKP